MGASGFGAQCQVSAGTTAPAIAATGCALAGGALCLLTVHRRTVFSGGYLAIWLTLYLGGVAFALWGA